MHFSLIVLFYHFTPFFMKKQALFTKRHQNNGNTKNCAFRWWSGCPSPVLFSWKDKSKGENRVFLSFPLEKDGIRQDRFRCDILSDCFLCRRFDTIELRPKGRPICAEDHSYAVFQRIVSLRFCGKGLPRRVKRFLPSLSYRHHPNHHFPTVAEAKSPKGCAAPQSFFSFALFVYSYYRICEKGFFILTYLLKLCKIEKRMY